MRSADGAYRTVTEIQSTVFPRLQQAGIFVQLQWAYTFEGGKIHCWKTEPNAYLETFVLANTLVSQMRSEFEGVDLGTANPRYRWRKSDK